MKDHVLGGSTRRCLYCGKEETDLSGPCRFAPPRAMEFRWVKRSPLEARVDWGLISRDVAYALRNR
jgi:hypothetical protein